MTDRNSDDKTIERLTRFFEQSRIDPVLSEVFDDIHDAEDSLRGGGL